MSSGAKSAARSPASLGWRSVRASFSEATRERVQPCKILDASNSGFRIALKPMPKLEIGDEIILEHTDGTQQRVCVCWVSAHEVGLKVVAPDQPAR